MDEKKPPEVRRLFLCTLDRGEWLIFFRTSPDFLLASFPRQGLLDALLLSRLQIEGMLFHFLNDVFLLDFSLETTEGVLYRLAFLNSNFSHSYTPPIGNNE